MSMDQRPSSRRFSIHSDKSGASKSAESPAEKARRDSLWKNPSYSNPNSAITEETPGGTSYSLPSEPSCYFITYPQPWIRAFKPCPQPPRTKRTERTSMLMHRVIKCAT